MLRIELPSLPPPEYSANYSRGQHWSKKQRVTQAAHDEVIALVRNQGWHREPLEHAAVSITFHLPTRRKIDSQSLIERCKPWVDGLVGLVIKDDDLKCIGWIQYSHVYSRPAKTIIEIAPAGHSDGF